MYVSMCDGHLFKKMVTYLLVGNELSQLRNKLRK